MLRVRLATQGLQRPTATEPVQVVTHLGALQAQDERWTPWTVGLRAVGCDHAEVTRAQTDGSLVRTWLLRGTLHLVAARDLAWVRALIAPRVLRGNARRYRQLELDERTLERGASRLEAALQGGPAPRSALAAALADAGLEPTGQRLPHLLQFAALQGRLVCWPAAGRTQMYAPAPTPTSTSGPPEPVEALTRLAQRYLTGHGPATAEDFAWWSGFPLPAARRALDAVPAIRRVSREGRELVALASEPSQEPPASAHLLPPFDEFLIGYRDRTPMLRPNDVPHFHRGGGMPRRALLLDGTVAGSWTLAGSGRRTRLEIRAFRPLDARDRDLTERAATALERFYADLPAPLPVHVLHP